MKKTLVALFALGSMAMAADISYTIDNAYSLTQSSELYSAIDDALANNTDVLNLNQLSDSRNAVTVTLSDMYWSIDPATVENRGMLLTSVQVVSRNNGQYQNNVTMTVTVDGTSYTSATAVYPDSSITTAGNRGLITFNFADPVIITGAESLTLALSGPTGTSVYQPKTGFELHGDTPVSGEWHMGVRLNVKTPEPATATLSLLALAGLASRRRRH